MADILIARCDGLTGLLDATRSIFPSIVVQTCVVHVIRNAMRFAAYGDRKKIATVMCTIYTAPTMKEFDKQWGEKYPGAIDVWKLAGDEVVTFLDYPAELRRIIYTTNAIESINFQLRYRCGRLDNGPEYSCYVLPWKDRDVIALNC